MTVQRSVTGTRDDSCVPQIETKLAPKVTESERGLDRRVIQI